MKNGKFAVACALLFCNVPGALAQTASIRIDASHVENHISPSMYAAFIEMMGEDVKWGLTAEMIHDRSFEEKADYQGLPAGWQLEPDTRNDNVGAIHFEPTTTEAYPTVNQATGAPEHALRITLTPQDITDTRRGLSQGRLSVQQGVVYTGYLWAKVPAAAGYKGDITVALEEDNSGGATYARTSLSEVAGDWRQYSFKLVPNRTDRFAKLAFLFGGTGSLFLDQVSLEPAGARSQVRPDSEAMIASLHPSFLRWPGGNVAQDFHWRWSVGPRDTRPVWTNKAWSNAPEPGDFGTDEYLALCERLHIEPSITVNVDGVGATPEEAAAWVEYVNGPSTSKYGAMRVANGHPAPYGVKQWELGNEIFGNWVRGHVTAEQYAQRVVVYAQAMHSVDPSLRLIAVGEGVFPGSDAWNSAVLRIAGPSIDYLAVHDYTSRAQNSKEPDPRGAMMARAGEFERNYQHMADLTRQYAPGRNIRLIVNEWNLFYDAETIQSMDGAVYAARMMNGFERDGDFVAANCISDLLNGWVGGVIQASRDRAYGTAEYYAVKMWRDHLGADRVATQVTSPVLSNGLKVIDATAAVSGDRRTLFLKLSNAQQAGPVQINLDLRGFPHQTLADFEVMYARGAQVRNSFVVPEALQPQTTTVPCGEQCKIDLPPDSIAVLTLRRNSPSVPATRPNL